MRKIKCLCGRDITTFRGFRSEVGGKYTCKKCKRDITYRKLEQLCERIRKDYAG